jgi:hypothetical protein
MSYIIHVKYTNDRKMDVFPSEELPRFSENFVCIAPFGNESDLFINVSIIGLIEVTKA